MVDREVETVVIGGGIIGCSIAYHLAKRGVTVALLEKGIIGGEASGRNGGAVSQHGRDSAEIPIAMASVAMWSDLAVQLSEALSEDIEYYRCGLSVLAMTDDEAEFLSKDSKRQREQGLDVRFMSGQELREITPALSDRVIAGNYSPTDGRANPILTTVAFGRLARLAGAEVHENTAVVGIKAAGGKVQAVETTEGTIHTNRVVNAAGPWVPEICRWFGQKVPIIPRRTQIMTTQSLPPLFKEFISGNTLYFRQARSGQVHVGGGGAWEVTDYRKSTTVRSMSRIAARLSAVIPVLENAQFIRSWAGTLQITPDYIPIYGWLSEPEGLFITGGFNGHGFAMGPIVGKLVSEWLVDGKPSMSLDAFRLSRFPEGFDFDKEYRACDEPPASGIGGMVMKIKSH